MATKHWPEEGDRVVSVENAAGVGERVRFALNVSKEKSAAGAKQGFAASAVVFIEQMEKLRGEIKVGKRRFASELGLISITEKDGTLTLCPSERRRGKFAY